MNDKMDYILRVRNNKYYLEKKYIKDGKKIKKGTNNQDKIIEKVSHMGPIVPRVHVMGDDYKLYFGGKITLTLRNVKKHENDPLYQLMIKNFNEDTRVVNETKFVNKKRLAVLALSTSILTTIVVANVTKKPSFFDGNEALTTITYVSPNPTNNPTPTIVPSSTIAPTIEPTIGPTPIITPIYDDRVKESQLLSMEQAINSDIIPIATRINKNTLSMLDEFKNTSGFDYFVKYGEEFGVDSYLALALAMNESNLLHERTLPGGKSYNGFAVGIMQHETPDKHERDVTAFNYATNEYETEKLCMESCLDLEKNIKLGIMLLQNRLQKYNNNIYITLQSYNYGSGVMDMILNEYASNTGKSIEDIINDASDIGWLENVTYFHEHPTKYINWKYNTYGDDKYIEHVLGYYLGSISVNKTLDNCDCYTNLITLEQIKEPCEDECKTR